MLGFSITETVARRLDPLVCHLSGFRLGFLRLPSAGAPRKKPFHFRRHGDREARKVTGHRSRRVSSDVVRPSPSLTRLSNGGAGRGLRRLRRSLWRQRASRVHGARLRGHAPARGCGRSAVTMSASLVRATVRAVSKRKLQPTRAALTLVSRGGGRRRPAGRAWPADQCSLQPGERRADPGGNRRGHGIQEEGHAGKAPRRLAGQQRPPGGRLRVLPA